MTDKLYVDPMNTSLREERALLRFGSNLGLSNGQFYRLGVLTYSRCLSESGSMPRNLKRDYEAISSRDQDYLKELMEERKASDLEQLKLAYTVELPELPKDIPNWASVPEDQLYIRYIQYLFTPEERQEWIARVIRKDFIDEDSSEIMSEFIEEFKTRVSNDPYRPIQAIEAGKVRRVLQTWADSQGGF